MAAKKQISIWLLAASIAVSSNSMCAADEVVFKNQGSKQIGAVVEENEQGVTIFFPKSPSSPLPAKKEARNLLPARSSWRITAAHI